VMDATLSCAHVIAGRAKLVSGRGVRDERRWRGRRSRVVLAPHGRRQGPDGIARSPTGLRGAVHTDRRGQHSQWSPGSNCIFYVDR
jgi:hypothetical protein